MFPVLDPSLKARITEEILHTMLADNVKARVLQPSGEYVRRQPEEGEQTVRAQLVLQALAGRQVGTPVGTSQEEDPVAQATV